MHAIEWRLQLNMFTSSEALGFSDGKNQKNRVELPEGVLGKVPA